MDGVIEYGIIYTCVRGGKKRGQIVWNPWNEEKGMGD